MASIRIGENCLIRRLIVASDGTTAVPIAGLQALSVDIIQFNRVLASFVLIPTPNPIQTQIRVGPNATNELEVEIEPSLSEAKLKEGSGDGAVMMKIYAEQTNASYITHGKLKDIDQFEIFDII